MFESGEECEKIGTFFPFLLCLPPALLFPPPNTRVTSYDAAALLWALKDNPPLPRMTWLWSAEEETLTGTCLSFPATTAGREKDSCAQNTRDEEEQKRERDVERRKSQQHARHDRMCLLLFSRTPALHVCSLLPSSCVA